MKVIGIIPARYDSTRYPGKPLVDIRGKTMIRRVYERSAKASSLDRLVVATDNEQIMAEVASFGGECLLTDRNHPSGTDRLAEASGLLQLSPGDVVVNIQGDEPMVHPEMIQSLVDAMFRTDFPMATLAFESTNMIDFADANVVKVVVDRSWKALYFTRAPVPFTRDPEEPAAFLRHLGYYAYRSSFLREFTGMKHGRLERLEKLEQLRALENGHSIQVASSPYETVGIDCPSDLLKLPVELELR